MGNVEYMNTFGSIVQIEICSFASQQCNLLNNQQLIIPTPDLSFKIRFLV